MPQAILAVVFRYTQCIEIKSFLRQRESKKRSPKLKHKCLSLVVFRDRSLAVILSQKIGLNFMIFND